MELQFCKKHQFLRWNMHICADVFQKRWFLQWIMHAFCPGSIQNISLFKNIIFYNELWATFQKHQFLQWIMSLLQQSSDGWLGCLGCCLAGLLGCLASPLFPRRLRPGFPHRLGPPGSKTYEKSMISVQIVKKPNVFRCF